MNDFTEEELNIIHLDMCTYVERNKILKESPSHKALREKVEVMMDNYCQHNLYVNIHPDGTTVRCGKCNLNMI
jgi:hypothetical protein